MRYIKKLVFAGCLGILIQSTAQQPTITIMESGKKVSIRGLSVVTDHIIWASGSSGSVARSVDGGTTWNWLTVRGYEKRDFRDIEAFDEHTAIIMGVAEPAIILKTKDGGKSWKKVFEDSTKGMFLDAMDFSDKKRGIVIGDPISNLAFLASTEDGGDHWETLSPARAKVALHEGEAFFASSGSNIQFIGGGRHAEIVFVSGGKSSRLFSRLKQVDALPVLQGLESTGANSLAVYKTKKGIVVGGDFAKDTIRSGNCVLLKFGNAVEISKPITPPHGYRSCVIYLDEKKLLTCGTSGIDISNDGGMNWQLISKESFHVCQKAKKGKAVFLAGGNGRIARLVNP